MEDQSNANGSNQSKQYSDRLNLDHMNKNTNEILSEQQFPSSKNSVVNKRNTKFLTEDLANTKNKKIIHELILTEEDLNGVSDEELRRKIRLMFRKEKGRFSEDIIKQCEGLMDKHGLGKSKNEKGNLLDEFYRFCQETLPYDEKYKESVLFVSMFYYFLERKKLIG